MWQKGDFDEDELRNTKKYADGKYKLASKSILLHQLYKKGRQTLV